VEIREDYHTTLMTINPIIVCLTHLFSLHYVKSSLFNCTFLQLHIIVSVIIFVSNL